MRSELKGEKCEAKAFVNKMHRHHTAPVGSIFQIAVSCEGKICGVAMVGRPIARYHDDGWTVEVNRVCTDETKNACSILYSACWRVAKNLGYKRIITYTLKEESGSSLKGAGWKVIGESKGGSWSRNNRPRIDKHPLQKKICWSPQ